MDIISAQAELKVLTEKVAPLYAELESIPEKEAYCSYHIPYGDTNILDFASIGRAKELHKLIAPISNRINFLNQFLADEARKEIQNKFYDLEQIKLAELPTKKLINSFELIHDGTNYHLRDPKTKECFYKHWKLVRMKEVANECKPE